MFSPFDPCFLLPTRISKISSLYLRSVFSPWNSGMRDVFAVVVVGLALALPSVAHAADAETPQFDPQAIEFFERDIRPLLVERCYKCHGDGEDSKGGLTLTSRAAILRGGDSGPAAVAGNLKESLIVEAVEYKDALQMPPDGKLEQKQIDLFSKWVMLGMPWPATAAPAEGTPERAKAYEFSDAQKQFWSFQQLARPVPPQVERTDWIKTDVDRFILAQLEQRKVTPAPPADKRTLIRRVTFDLTGLPPTPEDVAAFLADASPEAYARVVDRLLASPAYGEHWGRHWLDVVRYTDSKDVRDLGQPYDIVESYRYRDWVVRAMNQDLPYDQFVRYQIAGDLLPTAGPDEVNADAITATGLLTIGSWGAGDADVQKMYSDMVDDQINVVSRAFLGLSVGCARCHDHKFDPIPTADYYGLAGIFFSTQIAIPQISAPYNKVPLVSKSRIDRFNQAVAAIKAKRDEVKSFVDAQYAALPEQHVGETGKYLLAVYDYQHRPAEKSKSTPPEFAAEVQLRPDAFGQWIEYLNGTDDQRLLDRQLPGVDGKAGIFAWRGPGDTPVVVLNTLGEPAELPGQIRPHGVGVHPGPNSGVGVIWKSPLTGTIKISGRVAHVHVQCGNGIAWAVQKLGAGGAVALGGGELPRGGEQQFSTLPTVQQVPVAAGESIRIIVLPSGEHSCDMSALDLEIAEQGGEGRLWSLGEDLLAALPAGGANPAADHYGNSAVWSLAEVALASAVPHAERGPGGPLAAWFELVEKVSAGAASRTDLEQVALRLQEQLEQLRQQRAQAATAPTEPAAGAAGPMTAFYQALVSKGGPFRVTQRDDEKLLPAESKAARQKMLDEIAGLEKETEPYPVAMAAVDGGVGGTKYAGFHDAQIHIRGRYDRLGELVPRHFPRIIAGDNQPPITQGSGRLELAQWITRPDNPLIARVIVNRIWLHHFGQGLVRTPGNFGMAGEAPTHPELLDFLAGRFIESGWSIKAMHRLLVESAVYLQSSHVAAEIVAAEPENRLWGRMNRRRLEAEAIRDTVLSVSGQLDRTLGGPVVRKLDEYTTSRRRTLYLMTNRSDKTNFRFLFDGADPENVVDQRSVSTVAPQALYMLNNPLALAQCSALVERLMRESPQSDTERIDRAYELLFGRPPTGEERELGLAFLTHLGQRKPEAADPARWAWEAYCQSLLCANELIYVD